MAKARKKARKAKARKPTRRAAKRKVTARAKPKARKAAKRRSAPVKPKEGPIEHAIHAVVDTVKETRDLRQRLAGHNTFED